MQGTWGCSTGQGRAGQVPEMQMSEEPPHRSALTLQQPNGPARRRRWSQLQPPPCLLFQHIAGNYLSLQDRLLIKPISLKEAKMESFTSWYSSAFWHLFPHQLGCKLVIQSAIQWLCSREALQHAYNSRKAGGRHRLGGHDGDREGTSTALGVLRNVAGGNSPGWAVTPAPGMEHSQQKELWCFHEL